MITNTKTLFGYTIRLVNGATDGNQNSWVLGKPGYSQLYYFDNQNDALLKLIELQGIEPVVRAVNAHDELLQAFKIAFDMAQRGQHPSAERMNDWLALISKAEGQS